MEKIKFKALTYDDVLLLPRYSDFTPKEASLRTNLTREISLNLPIISAAMDTVTESSMAIEIAKLGGIGVIHRNLDIKKQILEIKKVFYKTPHSMWRFYGYYGGLNTIGNLSTYGMYGDDSTFEVIPPWQNKLQAMAYEDAIWTRNSHYSYELKNNNLKYGGHEGLIKNGFYEYLILLNDKKYDLNKYSLNKICKNFKIYKLASDNTN